MARATTPAFLRPFLRWIEQVGFDNWNTTRYRISGTIITVWGLLTLTFFCISSVYEADYQYAGILLCFIIAVGANLWFSLHYERYYWFAKSTVVIFVILLLYLGVSGGYHGSGVLWNMVFPGIAFYMLGLRGGLVYTLLVGAFMGVVLYEPQWLGTENSYPGHFKQRLLGVYFGLVFLSFIYEYTRANAHRSMTHAAKRLDVLAHTDSLTKIPNRHAMQSYLDELWQLPLETRHLTALFLIDLDYFKSINDRFGHGGGDVALKSVARTLNGMVRESDMIARWGGEEFLVAMTLKSIDELDAVAERLRSTIEGIECRDGDELIPLSASLGASFAGKKESWHQLLVRVDALLYEAKQHGRNRAETALPF